MLVSQPDSRSAHKTLTQVRFGRHRPRDASDVPFINPWSMDQPNRPHHDAPTANSSQSDSDACSQRWPRVDLMDTAPIAAWPMAEGSEAFRISACVQRLPGRRFCAALSEACSEIRTPLYRKNRSTFRPLAAHLEIRRRRVIVPLAEQPKHDGTVACRERLSGLVKYYHRPAAWEVDVLSERMCSIQVGHDADADAVRHGRLRTQAASDLLPRRQMTDQGGKRARLVARPRMTPTHCCRDFPHANDRWIIGQRGLDLRPPQPALSVPTSAVAPLDGRIQRRDRLGGLVHEYVLAAWPTFCTVQAAYGLPRQFPTCGPQKQTTASGFWSWGDRFDTIFVVQPAEHRFGDDTVAVADPMAAARWREPIGGRIGDARPQARVWTPSIVVTHPLRQHFPHVALA